MYRFNGHSVRGSKTLWCGGKVAKIVTTRKIGEAPVHACGKCGVVAVKY